MAVAGDRLVRQLGQFVAVGLGFIEQARAQLKAWDLFFGAVLAFHAEVALEDIDRDGAFATAHAAAELVPGLERRYARCVWALHRDEHAVLGAVAMELCAGGEPCEPALARARLAIRIRT